MLFLILFRPVAPEESFTDMTSRGIDNIYEFVEDVHCITAGSIILFQFFWKQFMSHPLFYRFLTAHSPSTLLKVVRDTKYAEKGITYRLKTRIAGVPIISNWDKWKATYGKNKRACFFHYGFPFLL
jgi:hypothetical protein